MNSRYIGQKIKTALSERGETQEYISKRTGVDQSQISRIMRGDFERLTKNVMLLCKYADISVKEDLDPSENQELMNALKFVWDGTDRHAHALAKVIRSFRAL